MPRDSKPDIELYLEIESELPSEWCLRPKAALDLFLYARKGPLQSMMIPKKEQIVIKNVPTQIVPAVIKLLPMPDWIYFYKSSGRGEWKIEAGTKPGFNNLVLRFYPTTKLKPVIKYLFPSENVLEYPVPDWLLDDVEFEWKPWGSIPNVSIRRHINFWRSNTVARTYAANDVRYLEMLYEHWGCPIPGDTDSELAVSVGCARWRGFAIDQKQLSVELESLIKVRSSAPKSPNGARHFINPSTFAQRVSLPNTKEESIERFIKIFESTQEACRAQKVIDARHAEKRVDILKKLQLARRFFPGFIVIGTKTGRMSGTGKLNPQGIPRTPSIRSLFTLADKEYVLSGGDYEGFEVSIADACYNDSNLHNDLLNGKSLHALLGQELYDKSYDEVLASKKLSDKDNIYTPAKNSVFAMFYGAMAFKIASTANISEETAEKALKNFYKRYPNVQVARQAIFDQFCSVHQPGGKGTKVLWREPAVKIESLLDFQRWYTLENGIIKGIFYAADQLPVIEDICIRSDREQSVTNATRSALYSTVFRLQQRNMRTAANHVIQSTGAGICKELQISLWNLQPKGIATWHVQLLNIHDEVLCVHAPGLEDKIKTIIDDHIDKYKTIVPLIGIDWKFDLGNWSNK
jgi:hypothetical protein